MTIEIKHTIEAADLAAQITQGVQQGLDGFGAMLQSSMEKLNLNDNKPLFTKNDNRNTETIKSDNKSNVNYSSINQSQKDSLTRAIEDLTKIMANKSRSGSPLAGYASLPSAERQTVLAELKQQQAEAKQSRLQGIKEQSDFYDERRSRNRYRNIAAGVVTGAAMAAVYQAGTFGATEGQKSQSVNAGAMNYSSFMNNLLNQQVSNQQSALSMASVAAGAGIGMNIGGLPGMLVGGVVGGVANYFTNKSSEQIKALNTLALGQDLGSQQLSAFGISSPGNKNLYAKGSMFGLGDDVKIPLSKLQSSMLSDKNYQSYLPYASDVMMSTRRDVTTNMSTSDQMRFVKNSTRLAMLTGSSAGEVGNTAGKLSVMTGDSTNKTLDKLFGYQVQYGGDMKNSVSKIINLMQTTGIGKDNITKLVGEYQYNEPMLQQKVAQSKVAPTGMFTGLIYQKMVEEQTGVKGIENLKADYRERVARAQKAKSFEDINPKDLIVTQMQQKMFTSMNIDPFVQDIGKVTANIQGAKSLGAVKDTDAQKAVQNMISDSLKNISTDNMNVTATGIVNIINSSSSSNNPVQTTGSNYPAITSGQHQQMSGTSNYPASPHNLSLKKLFNEGAWDNKYTDSWRQYVINRSNQGDLGKIKK